MPRSGPYLLYNYLYKSDRTGIENLYKYWPFIGFYGFGKKLKRSSARSFRPKGRFVVNRLSGTIQVTDLHRRVEEVATFLVNVRNSLYRQVEIQVRIYEIALRDDYSLGVDWSRIDLSTPKGQFQAGQHHHGAGRWLCRASGDRGFQF